MARKIYWKAEHVRTLAELPDKLVRGRAYFIDEEGYIVIDHGDGLGPQIYGNRPGIQGPPGEPVPKMLNDIEAHSLAIANLELLQSRYDKTYEERFTEIERIIGAMLGVLAQKENIDLEEYRQALESENNS